MSTFPNSTITLYSGVKLSNDQNDTFYFDLPSSQETFFNNLSHISVLSNQYRIEPTKNVIKIELPYSLVEYEKQFLRENQNVNIEKYGNEIIGILLPDKVTLKVVECDPASKGSASSNQMKDAVLETGMTIKVPLFIESGEDIIISTDTGKYSSRA